MLTIQNVNSDPFVPTCNTCDVATETFAAIDNDKLHCSNCEQQTSYRYLPRVDVTYEKYLEDTCDIIYSLQDFHIHGTFTLDHANVILDKV